MGFNHLYRPFYDNLFATEFKDEIVDWAYQTTDLYTEMMVSQQVEDMLFSDKAKIYFLWMDVYGVSPNFIKVLPQKEFSLVKSDAYDPYDPY